MHMRQPRNRRNRSSREKERGLLKNQMWINLLGELIRSRRGPNE